MKPITVLILTVLAVTGLMGQSNEMIDAFLKADTADVATSMLLIAQSVGDLPIDADLLDGYEWALEQIFGKYVKKKHPGAPLGLGLFYLALLESSDIDGGFMFNLFRTPRYAAYEATYRGYVDPSTLYHTRSMPPYEVITGITYLQEDLQASLEKMEKKRSSRL